MGALSSSPIRAISSNQRANRNNVILEVLIALDERRNRPWGLCIYELADLCPSAKMEYLKTRVHIWQRSGHLIRRKVFSDKYQRRLFHYRISDAGIGYLLRTPKHSRQAAKGRLEAAASARLARLKEQWAKKSGR